MWGWDAGQGYLCKTFMGLGIKTGDDAGVCPHAKRNAFRTSVNARLKVAHKINSQNCVAVGGASTVDSQLIKCTIIHAVAG